MILGADPFAKPPKAQEKKRPPLWSLLNYFITESGMRPIGVQQKAALTSAMKRLLNEYDEADVRKYIDRYFVHLASKGTGFPLSFCSKKLQEQLIEGDKQDADDVQAWISNDFVREDWMDLPWDEVDDRAIRSAIIRNPDAVEEILSEF